MLIYGPNKTGKTTIASKFPKALILSFEVGTNALPGVQQLTMFTWSDALDVKSALLKEARQLRRGEIEETTFDTIVIDTADQEYMCAERFICEANDIDELSDLGYGKGYAKLGTELDLFHQELLKNGYTLLFIAHEEQKQIDKDDKGNSYLKISPSIPKRGLKLILDLVDITAYTESVMDDEGNTEVFLVTRGNKTLEAGSRYAHMSPRIPFTYEALLADVQQAVDKVNGEVGTQASTEPVYKERENAMTYDDAIAKVRQYHKTLHENNMDAAYTECVEKYLGKGKLVRDCTPAQMDVLEAIVNGLGDKIEELGLVVM